MKTWQVLLLSEIAVDVLIGGQFFLWYRGRKLCFWPTLVSWGLTGWGVFLLVALLTHQRCCFNWEFWLTTGLIAWFSGPALVLWWLYGAHRWRPTGLVAQMYQKVFGNCDGF